MTPSNIPDVIVVGSGPCGAMAAREATAAGANVLMVDYGIDDSSLRALVPDLPFSQIRKSDPNQAAYFIGTKLEGVAPRGIKVGAQLTPPRQFVSRETNAQLPLHSDTFHPMQSLALGGLGSAWGAACFTYSAEELSKVGLSPAGFADCYNQVARQIGISGPGESGSEQLWWSGVRQHQPGLQLDSNAESILGAYRQRQSRFEKNGFHLGQIPLAVLSQDLGDRRANPYFDMDFYGDSRKSVFRPRYIIDQLRPMPNFVYRGGLLAIRFEESLGLVTLHCRSGAGLESLQARRLIVCAGAINSARLALNSMPTGPRRTSILCNGYTYFPSLNLRMFGQTARDKRHSLAQLHAFVQEGHDLSDNCSAQIYSYRSLLLFKLIKEMPLPPWLGLQCARTMVNALAIFGAFFADSQSDQKYMEIVGPSADRLPHLTINYRPGEADLQRRRRIERSLKAHMRKLGCIPLSRIDPGAAGSIHYAGTLPFSNPLHPALSTQPDYRLADHHNVFIGDSSSWNWLPSKGLTFTAMASATRVARMVLATL